MFLSGCKGGLIRNLIFSNVDLSFRRWTNYVGGLVDYRPGCSGLVNHSMAGMIMEYVDGLVLQNVSMKWSQNGSVGWDRPLDFRASTVNNITITDFHSGSFSDQ